MTPTASLPQSGVLVAGPRRGKDVSLVVLVCTFGIATMWPHASQRWRLRRTVWNGVLGVVPDTWVPGWWDQASDEVEQALIRAAGCLAEAGYEYVPDPVFDEPYDGRFAEAVPRAQSPDWLNPEMRWWLRYFELQPRKGTASYALSPSVSRTEKDPG